MNIQEREIIEIIKRHQPCSSKEIHDELSVSISYSTVKRTLTKLVHERFLITEGKGKGTKYLVSDAFVLLEPVDITVYFKDEIDERKIKEGFNFALITDVLLHAEIFSRKETERLNTLQGTFRHNISQLSENEYRKEMERLAIDLSWKSSQIEGNTYSLLETEKLLREKETATGKTKEEAVMLLNHKDAIDFILENPDYLELLAVSKIEDIHRILVKELAIENNIRRRRTGISGTNYRPLDNEFQIREALSEMCRLINQKNNIFDKALLVLVLISYIQPFTDGNKRTARIISNAILMHHGHCPISFRTVDSMDYKKAMLLFYEQNNISGMKEIFMDQFDFAVNTYF